MYLRIKKVGNHCYLYIDANTRNNPSGTPQKKTLTYLGRLENYSEGEIKKLKDLLKEDSPELVNYLLNLTAKEENKKYKSMRLNKESFIKKEKKCAICGFNSIVHLHHLVPVSRGGLFDNQNLIYLCPNHHAMLHKGLITFTDLQSYLKRDMDGETK